MSATMTPRRAVRCALLVLAGGLSGAVQAQADLLAPLHGPMTAPVRTPQEADAVCTSVLVAQFVEQTIERTGRAGGRPLTEGEALGQLSADPSWASRVVPMIHSICRCAMDRVPGGGSDLLGHVTTDESAQAFVHALQQPAIREACVASAQPASGAAK